MLRGIAETFRGVLRDYDVPSRFGGEEFAILLPETTPEEAFEIAERIRRTVAATAFEVETSSEPIRATISFGVAGYPKDGTDVERADPPGRPRRVPREAPGAQPRARRELRAAARPGRPGRAAGRRSGCGRGRGRAARRGRSRRRPRRSRTPQGAASASPCRRAALPRALADPRRAHRADRRRRHRRRASLAFFFAGPGDLVGLIAVVVAVGDRPGARARAGRRRLGLRERRRCARRRSHVRAARRPAARDHDRGRAVERHAQPDLPVALQRRRAHARLALGRGDLLGGLDGRRRRPPRHRARRAPRGRRVLRRQHRHGLGRDGARGPRQLAARVDGALLLAHAALRRVRRHRRRDRALLPGDRPLRPRGLRPAAPAHAQDDGGLHRPHAALEPQAPRGGRDDPLPERVARAGQPAAEGTLDGRHGEPLGDRGRARRLHGRPFAARAAALARDRPRAGPLAGRARPPRPRGALPRHRQARDPRRDPPEAGDARPRTSGRSCSATRTRARASSTGSDS